MDVVVVRAQQDELLGRHLAGSRYERFRYCGPAWRDVRPRPGLRTCYLCIPLGGHLSGPRRWIARAGLSADYPDAGCRDTGL